MKPGGKQPAMCNTIWHGKEYSMVFNLAVPKDSYREEADISGMKLEDMCKGLASHED